MKKKDKPVYCGGCDYYIKELQVDGQTHTDVCGFHLQTEKDAVGREVFKRYGHKECCEKCGTMVHDESKVVVKSVHGVNNNNKCKFFKKKAFRLRLPKVKLNIRLPKFGIPVTIDIRK